MTGKRASPVVQSRVPSRARLLVGLAALLGLLLLGLRRLPAPEAGPAKLGSQTNSAEPGWLLLAGFEQSSELDEEPKQGQIETSTANETSKSFKQLDEQPATLEQRPEVRPRPRRLAPDQRPILNEFSFPANLVQGMRFVLMCQVLADGSPADPSSGSPVSGVQIRWFKDRQELSWPSSGELELIAPQADELAQASSSILFRRVQPEHNGNYTCLATNQLGLSASYSSTLSVKVPPKWKIEPKDREASLGDQISIDCQASGNPNPFIRWKFTALVGPNGNANGRLATDGQQQLQAKEPAASGQPSQFKLINSNHHVQTLENGSLAFRALQREHEGLYLCEADNGLEPSLVKPVRLVVHQPATIADELRLLAGEQPAEVAALVDKSPVPVRAIRLPAPNKTGSQLRLLCEPSGELPMQIDWLKDGRLVQSHTMTDERPEPRHQLGAGLELADSSGRYHMNTRRKSTSGQLTVAQLESELLITDLRRPDAGLYSCLVRNQFGEAQRKMRLLLQEAPEAPELVDVAHISSRSIGLRWLSPFDGNAPILRYVVEYRRQTDSPNYAAETEPMYSEKLMPGPGAQGATTSGAHQIAGQVQQQVQHTVHELDPLTRYSMRVTAVNALGRSRPSVALSLRTEEEVPSVVPSNVEALVLSSHSVKLNWTITYSAEHDIIDGFFIGYRSLDVALTSTAASANAVQQPPLAEQTTFTYKTIRLGGQPEMGARSQQHQAEPGSAFLAPKSSVSKQTLLAGHRQPVIAISSSFEYLITGLERNSDYTLLIQCFNRKGAGPTSDPVLFRTFANDPPDRLQLSADETSESSIRLSWRFLGQPTGSVGSARRETLLDGFLLTFAPQSSLNIAASGNLSHEQLSKPAARIVEQQQRRPSDQWQSLQLAPQQHAHLLKGLECGTTYVMKIWAFNKVGKGEPSEPLIVSTRGKAPLAPDRRSFITVNSSQVRLNLGAWYDGGCEIDKFVIQYRARGQQEWNLVSNNIQREQGNVLVRDLLPGTAYELLVAAQNQVATTEIKYRFTTLDANGHQVGTSVPLFPFLGSLSPSQADDEDEFGRDTQADYADDLRRDTWSGPAQANPVGAHERPLLAVRNLLGSPLALVISLSLFLAILLMLVFYRTMQDRHSNSSSSTLSSAITNKSSANGSPSTASVCGPQITCTEANNISFTMLDGDPFGQPLNNSVASESIADSPQVNPGARHLHNCRYQTYCTASGLMKHDSQVRRDGTHFECANQLRQNIGGPDFYANQGQSAVGHYASVHRSTSLEAPLENSRQVGSGEVSNQDQCLMQMLLMSNGPQQANNLIEQTTNQSSNYAAAAAALATLARAPKAASLRLAGGSLATDNSSSLVAYSPVTCSSGAAETGQNQHLQFHFAPAGYHQDTD